MRAKEVLLMFINNGKRELTIDLVIAAMEYYKGDAVETETELTILEPFMITELCSEAFDGQAFSSNRKRNNVDARHASFYLIKKYNKKSLVEIARLFSCDHTTVIHGIKQANNHIKNDDYYRQIIHGLEKKIKSEVPKMAAA